MLHPGRRRSSASTRTTSTAGSARPASRSGSLEFYETDASRGLPARRQVGGDPGLGPQLLALGGFRSTADLGAGDAREPGRILGRAFDWFITVEDLPEEANGVTLDPVLTDATASRRRGSPTGVRRTAGGARLRRRACSRGARGRRAPSRRSVVADPRRLRLAPARHGADGRRPGHVGVRPVRADARRAEPVRRRRQRVRHGGGGEPDRDDLRVRAARGRAHRRDGPAAGDGRRDARGRATFAGLADVLVPATGGMPSASEIGVHERWVDRVIAARPDLAGRLEALLAAAAGCDPGAEVARLQAEEDDGSGCCSSSSPTRITSARR